MGRPLSKKFIGNRNIGSTGTGDDNGIGGEGVASISLPSGANNSSGYSAGTANISIALPALPTGVRAVASLIVGPAGALLTIAAGTSATNVTTIGSLTGTAVATTATYTSVPQKSSNGSGTGATFIVVRSGGTNYNANTVVTANGKGTGYISGNTVTISGANLGGVDGTNDLTITLGGSVAAAGTITGFTITEKGSGYTSVPAVTLSTGTQGTLTVAAVLTTDSGNVGSATNQENAIQITAWVPATGTAGNISGNGTSAVVGDIVRQTGNGKYIVRTAQGVGRVKLVAKATGSLLEGEANIIATDSVTPTAGTYYVTKISDRRCNIVAATGTQFTTGTDGINVSWTFNGTSGDKVLAEQPYLTANVNVKIANA